MFVAVKVKNSSKVRKTAQVSNDSSIREQADAFSSNLIKEIPAAQLQDYVLSEWSDNEAWWWDREYKIVIEEEKKLSKNPQEDIAVKLAMRRYFSSIETWGRYMDEKERELRKKEIDFILRNPKQENYLNQVGYERAIFWEEAIYKISKP